MSTLSRLVVILSAALLVAGLAQAPQSQASPPDPVAAARSVLAGRAESLGLNPDGLQALSVRSGLAGQYVRFQETAGGIPVEGAQVVVGLPDDEKRTPVVARGVAPVAQTGLARRVTAAAALKLALRTAGIQPRSLRDEPQIEEIYLNTGKEAVPGWRITLPGGDGTWLAGIRADTGEVLYLTDLRRSDSGRVFNPNPPKGSGGTIPPPTDCDSAANEALLSGQYQTLTIQGRTPAQDKLKGQYVDLTAPGIIGGYKPAGVAGEASGSFIYGCNDDRFEEVMVYHHLDATQRKIQALGFSGQSSILARPIPAHAHYFNDCNAFYDPVDRGVHFGDADVCMFTADAAEDADVIVHEYGHAIQDDQVPAWGFGSPSMTEEASAMGEGFSDFLTGIMFGDSCLGEWFSFGGSCLRDMENTAVYPQDYDDCRPAPPQPAEPHCAGLIWGGALWDLAQALGDNQQARDTALTLVLESHFLLDPQSTFAEGAAAIRQADQLLFGGAHSGVIDSVFAARGIGTLGGVSDFPYAYLRIRHTFRGDLDVNLLVGSTSSPICTLAVWEPDSRDGADDLVGWVDLSSTLCTSYLPPTAGQPWYLAVRDAFAADTGTLEEFEIVLPGPARCIASDVPLAVPDAGPTVYSRMDCLNTVEGTTDDDGDGFGNITEVYVGTDALVRCGGNEWPADLVSLDVSENRFDIMDLTSFIVPARRLSTSPGDPDFQYRWDVQPGPAIPGSPWIDILDLTVLFGLRPPMLGGQAAFNQYCP